MFFYLVGEKDSASGNPVSLENATAMAANKKLFEDTKKRTTKAGFPAVIVILLAAVLFTVIISVVVFVSCYRKRLKDKFPDNSATQKVPRRRLSSSGSINSTTSLLKHRNGSYSSRLSSWVSSRIDSNIAEGKELSLIVYIS